MVPIEEGEADLIALQQRDSMAGVVASNDNFLAQCLFTLTVRDLASLTKL
jgi:hypothetical protein